MFTYFDREAETAPVEKIRKSQFRRLKKLVEFSYQNNAFYRTRFQQQGIKPEDLRKYEDIRKLPFLYKREVQDDQLQNPPFGTNLVGGMENYVRYHQTTGTTGAPVRWLDSKETWTWRGRCAAMSMSGSGITAKDILFFPFAFGPHVAYWGIWEGAWNIGALAIAGGGWDSIQRIKAIFETGATVIPCTPTYALRLAEVAKENGIDLTKSSVRMTFHAGEPGALIPSVRRRITESWGAQPFDYPGLTEVGNYGIHCTAQETAIHVNEAEFIFELIDPATGEPIEGEGRGEMVLTNLGRVSSPSIRFRTGDIVNVKRHACPCGRSFPLLDGGIVGRVDDMICVRGINIFPSQVAAIVEKHLVIGEEYQVVAYSEKGMAELKVVCELLEERAHDEILQGVKNELRAHLEIRIEVERVPRGTIQRSEYKSKKFVDKRTREA